MSKILGVSNPAKIIGKTGPAKILGVGAGGGPVGPFSLAPFKLTLPVNAAGVLSGAADALEILPSTDPGWSPGDPDLLTFEHPQYFKRTAEYFEFTSPNFGAYTSTATDARSELRHLKNYSPTETMRAKFSFYVPLMANNAKANIGQIHRLDADPVFKLTYTSKSNGTGTYRALVKKTDGAADFSFDIGLGDKVLVDNLSNGDSVTGEYEFNPVAETLRFWINDAVSETAIITGVQSSGFESYHKIGDYTNDPGDGTVYDDMSSRVTSWENLAP